MKKVRNFIDNEIKTFMRNTRTLQVFGMFFCPGQSHHYPMFGDKIVQIEHGMHVDGTWLYGSDMTWAILGSSSVACAVYITVRWVA